MSSPARSAVRKPLPSAPLVSYAALKIHPGDPVYAPTSEARATQNAMHRKFERLLKPGEVISPETYKEGPEVHLIYTRILQEGPGRRLVRGADEGPEDGGYWKATSYVCLDHSHDGYSGGIPSVVALLPADYGSPRGEENLDDAVGAAYAHWWRHADAAGREPRTHVNAAYVQSAATVLPLEAHPGMFLVEGSDGN